MGASERAPCGHGAFGVCCCSCRFQLRAKPRCACLGGPGEVCKAPKNHGILGKLADEAVDENTKFVCTLFANEGIVLTDWTLHGVCEGHMPREIE